MFISPDVLACRLSVDRVHRNRAVPPELLTPRNTWADKAAYERTAVKVAKLFQGHLATVEAPDAGPVAGPRHGRKV